MKRYEYLTDHRYKNLILGLMYYVLPENDKNDIERITITRKDSSYKITITSVDKMQEQWICDTDKQIFARMFTRKPKEG